MKLNYEERLLLGKLTKEQLIYLSSLAENKEFDVFRQIVNYLIDQEKNIFFSSKEYDKDKLAADHAFSRGGIAKMVMFLHIIAGSKAELDHRSKETKKK
jgi:hypothetical protein